jgi:sugar fermentation stimulation protein A
MKFPGPLITGTLIKRYKRFLADITLESGEQITAHCANPGAMTGLATPGAKVWLSESSNPKRKLKYSWELIEADGTLVGINTQHPNKIVAQAINDGFVSELTGYGTLKTEQRYGNNSRIDILLEDSGKSPCYVEIKNVHLMRTPGLAEFPDSVTARGAKHLDELADMVMQGNRAMMFYLIQRQDAKDFALAKDIDPHYAARFAMAREAGVEAIAYACKLSETEIKITNNIAFSM